MEIIMNKEETYYTIKKLIKLYEKRVKTCKKEYNILNESNPVLTEEYSQIENILSEQSLMEEFIDDLKSLMEDE